MKKQISALLAGGALLAFVGTANAGQPLRLTDNQMDLVAAGSAATAEGASVTFGELFSDTATLTSTEISAIPRTVGTGTAAFTYPRIVVGQAFSQGVAAGGFLFNAASVSHAQASAVW
jgi:hypothetical protein